MILSTKNNFYSRIKQLEGIGLARKFVIDGAVFRVPGLDFETFLEKGVAVGRYASKNFSDNTYTIYPRVYKGPQFMMRLGEKSYIESALIEGNGVIIIGKYSNISWREEFELSISVASKYSRSGHDYHSVANYDPGHLNWHNLKPPIPPDQVKPCRIMIGNDVWIGRGCRLKSTDPDRPLVIGDGAVIASDSVVVKSVEPYTIVGGNPARFIKYRFDDPKIIEGLQRIRWWDWDIDKIHDNYKYFDDPRAFVERFDY